MRLIKYWNNVRQYRVNWAALCLQFMQKEGKTCMHAYTRLRSVYGEQCMSRAQFLNGLRDSEMDSEIHIFGIVAQTLAHIRNITCFVWPWNLKSKHLHAENNIYYVCSMTLVAASKRGLSKRLLLSSRKGSWISCHVGKIALLEKDTMLKTIINFESIN